MVAASRYMQPCTQVISCQNDHRSPPDRNTEYPKPYFLLIHNDHNQVLEIVRDRREPSELLDMSNKIPSLNRALDNGAFPPSYGPPACLRIAPRHKSVDTRSGIFTLPSRMRVRKAVSSWLARRLRAVFRSKTNNRQTRH
jgi:hypothetical protein